MKDKIIAIKENTHQQLSLLKAKKKMNFNKLICYLLEQEKELTLQDRLLNSFKQINKDNLNDFIDYFLEINYDFLKNSVDAFIKIKEQPIPFSELGSLPKNLIIKGD